MKPVKDMLLLRFLKAWAYYVFNHFITHVPWYGLRHTYLRFVFGIKIGQGSAMHMGCFITGNRITIGRNSVINRNCYLDGRFGIIIGNNVGISPECYLLSLTHDVNDPSFPTVGKIVELEDYAWLGVRSIILPGVHLSKGCVVGAGSVVTKSFAANQIIGGVPARNIGTRNVAQYEYNLNYFPFFDTDIAP